MKTAELRRRFLDFFATRGHEVVPSAPLIYNDPTLLFVNAGMVPFKPYFTGVEAPPFDRAASVQKSVSTLDIEEVGKTTRHATFFQMNGNFSFGDYFKAEAIKYAWDLVTGSVDDGCYGFDPDKIWVTVLTSDDEAALLWENIAGLDRERIQRRGVLDNYWHMGIPGPGGPCSKIYIDTGLGLERVAYLLQGVDNLYEIDQVYPVITHAASLAGKKYGVDHGDDVRL